MLVTQFKKGDIVHKLYPRKFKKTNLFSFGVEEESEDYSFVTSPIEIVEITSNLVFYKYAGKSDKLVLKDVYSFSPEQYNGEWGYYPKKYL